MTAVIQHVHGECHALNKQHEQNVSGILSKENVFYFKENNFRRGKKIVVFGWQLVVLREFSWLRDNPTVAGIKKQINNIVRQSTYI